VLSLRIEVPGPKIDADMEAIVLSQRSLSLALPVPSTIC
jgi:hypothetical protein